MFEDYATGTGSAYDEMFDGSALRTPYRQLQASGTRAGFQNEAQRLLGRTRAELEYRSLSDFVAELPSEMERLQRTCALATDAITRRYVAGAEATEWHGVRA